MPSAAQERSSQESGRSPRRQKSGRSSRVEARADARPGAGGRSSHIEDARPVRWPLVQESGRSSRRTLVQKRSFVPCRGRSSSQAEVDARPARQRTLVQNARPARRTLGQIEFMDYGNVR
ncbi:hypothetical protein LR48_Vigan09g199700 [Vigna angularis]|uniref:Uncharacterized protein n=1 Tax=Phaseolus angularis TaxID=3914 RepID=A0A0L9VEA7_PHAAN|nr:hypothetical protein LR48_Vigan09g199700 [Vigna angularis]